MIVLSVGEAEEIIFNLLDPLNAEEDVETVEILAARGRILAAPLVSQLDFPQWDSSAMDGYAVQYSDIEHCSPQHPVILKVVEEVAAGGVPEKDLQPGQAARIYTGAMLPLGADAIAIQENTQLDGEDVWITDALNAKEYVRRRGDFAKVGDILLEAGTRLGGREIAVLAANQTLEVRVYRQLTVAILSTGNELVPPDQLLYPGQVVDSNQYALSALVEGTGAFAQRWGIVPDEPESLKEAISGAVANADIVLSTGGVSLGAYDYVDKVLEDLGAKIHLKTVAIKPGKPLTVATFSPEGSRSVLYFGIPGNPVSSLVTFWRFVEPTIKRLSGLRTGWQPRWLSAKTTAPLRADGKRETYIWGQVTFSSRGRQFTPSSGSLSSANLINLGQTNALAVLPVGMSTIAAGEGVSILLADG